MNIPYHTCQRDIVAEIPDDVKRRLIETDWGGLSQMQAVRPMTSPEEETGLSDGIKCVILACTVMTISVVMTWWSWKKSAGRE